MPGSIPCSQRHLPPIFEVATQPFHWSAFHLAPLLPPSSSCRLPSANALHLVRQFTQANATKNLRRSLLFCDEPLALIFHAGCLTRLRNMALWRMKLLGLRRTWVTCLT